MFLPTSQKAWAGTSTHLGTLGRPVHFHTQVVPILLPVQLAVDDIEEIPDSDLLPGGQLHEGDSGWYVFVLRHPEGYDVAAWRPGKVSAKMGPVQQVRGCTVMRG